MTLVLSSYSQVLRAITWALICPCKPFCDSLALKAQPKSVPVLICACHVHVVFFSILFPLGLGLGVPC